MHVRTEKRLNDPLGNTYQFRFEDGYPSNLCIQQGNATVCIEAKEVKAFISQLNSFVEHYRKPVRA